MLSNAAFNALLKTLEEPPEHAIFVLATTEPHKILATVLSRCQRFDFHRISIGEMTDRLAWLARQEGIEAERQALELIARQATGSMRDAESLLDQLASYDEGGITVEEMRTALGIGADETVMQITQALADGDVAKGLGAINAAVEKGTDPRQFARQMVEHLRALLLLRLESGVVPPHIPESLLPSLQDQADAFSRRELARGVRLFNQAAQEAKGGWQPQLPLEMAFVEALLPSEPSGDGGGERSSSSQGRPGRSNPRGRHEPSRSGADRAAPAPSASGTKSAQAESKSDGKADASEQAAQSEAVRDPSATYAVSDGRDGPLTVGTIRGQWEDFLDALRPKDLSLEALMRSCEPVGVEEDVVVLSFAHRFHRGKVEEDKKRRIVEDALSDLFGRRLRVRCVTNKPGKSKPVQTVDRQGKDEQVSREQDASADPLVRMAVDELGAEVVQGRAQEGG